MGLPLKTQTKNYVFGRGKLFIGIYGSDPTRADRRFIGNCPGFSIDVESEIFEHFQSTEGLQTNDLTVTKSVKFAGEITCDDVQPENLALFLGGTVTSMTQVASAVTNEAIIVTKDYHYQLGLVGSNNVGIRDVTSVVVTNSAGSTTYVLDTDYKLDAASGMIYIIPAGAITNGQTIHVDYTPTAGTRVLITSGDGGAVDGEIVFESANANGTDNTLRIPLCAITPSGAMPFITEDALAEMTFAIGVSKRDTSTAHIYIANNRVA